MATYRNLIGSKAVCNREPYQQLANRRRFLHSSMALAASMIAQPAIAQPFEIPPIQQPKDKERRLRLRNVHTRERLDVVFWKDGNYINDHVGQLNFFMRDHHRNEAARMHVELYDKLFRLHQALETDAEINVLSGFRTRATNEKLREKDERVAKNSFHVKGKAVDFVIPGTKNDIIQKTARNMRLGGVGYYPTAHFVHLDTGSPRHWVMS